MEQAHGQAQGQPPGQAQSLGELREFTVTCDLGRQHTTYSVTPAGASGPVVSMHKDYAIHVGVRPYYVRPVAAPEQLLGYVKAGRAWDAEQTEIGRIGVLTEPRKMHRGPVVQHGLGTLMPMRDEKRGLLRRAAQAADWWSDTGLTDVLDSVTSARVRCLSAASPGFELTRVAGVTARYDVTVHDPHLSRLLVLAYVDCFNSAHPDVHHVVPTLTTNPFDNLRENARMKREKAQRDQAQRDQAQWDQAQREGR